MMIWPCRGCGNALEPETDVVVDTLVVRRRTFLGDEHETVREGPDHGFFHPDCWFEPNDSFRRVQVGLLATFLDELEPGWRANQIAERTAEGRSAE